ncbi:MAG: ankyrin repeat domain-containing protein [Planctomycetota bacterium]
MIHAAVTGKPAAEALLKGHPHLSESLTGSTRESALHYVVIENNLAAASVLLDLGLAVDARDSSNATPLSYAARLNYPALAALLLSRGADPSVRDDLDETPLHKASQSGAIEVIRHLLAAGADRRATSCLGETPRDVALPRRRTEIEALFDADMPGPKAS